MITRELKERAIAAWQSYGDALRIAFRWPEGQGLEMFSIEQVFATDDPEAVEQFIEYCRSGTADVRHMRFVGERGRE